MNQAPKCNLCGGDGTHLNPEEGICTQCGWLRPLLPGYQLDRSVFLWAGDGKAMATLQSVPALHAVVKSVSDKVGRPWIESTFNAIRLGPRQLADVWKQAVLAARILGLPKMPDVYISGDQMWRDTRRIRLRRRLPSTKRRLRPFGLRPRKKEKFPGEWASQVNGTGICSYPPEDLVVEDYGRFLKQKGKNLLSEDRVRVEPFTTSILDGIDMRETIRKWYERRIYVRQFQKMRGEVGSVVVIFDEDRDNRYPFTTTWTGESQNESDMAFYSTFPFENLVGPGIGRAEYGGFLMSLPPHRMYDVWRDADYEDAESKSERLLLAALDYSIHHYVVYVAAKPPRSIFKTIANRVGRTIVYIPIGQLSPVSLKKIRVVHVLDGHEKRAIVKDYLW